MIPLPESKEQQAKKCLSLRRIGVFFSAAVVVCAIAAVLLALGLFVAVIVFEFRGGLENALLYILIGSFAGGAVLFALSAFGLNVLGSRHRAKELDFRERCDGEHSFFVGDGTLVTFGEAEAVIHGEGETQSGKEIHVPYRDMRFFSVCTRRRPKEKGEWSVVLEIPAHYLSRDGREKPGEKPALVQADAKPRLYATLEARGLSLTGEREPASPAGGKKFLRLAKFDLPDRKKRRGALIFMGVGGVLAAGGVVAAVLWQTFLGALFIAVGLVLAARSVMTFCGAKGTLGVYGEGLYWRDKNRVDSVFLKWDEIDRIETAEGGETGVYRVQCPYGAYHFPAVGGSYEYLKEHHPEKFGERG